MKAQLEHTCTMHAHFCTFIWCRLVCSVGLLVNKKNFRGEVLPRAFSVGWVLLLAFMMAVPVSAGIHSTSSTLIFSAMTLHTSTSRPFAWDW